MSNTIHPQTKIGALHLTVSDLPRSLDYYQDRIGLSLRHLDAETAYLGAGGPDLLWLTERRDGRVGRGVTGLYHFALLLPSRLDLARALNHLINSETPIGGFADHSVSEAIYLSDPDGHGIEIYRDRRREEWIYQNGRLNITTEPFDAEGVLAELQGVDTTWNGAPPGTTVGHMHLHVSDLNTTERFYVDVLGFDLIARYGPAAMFVSAGGYHHHIGLNTWAGVGARTPPSDALRLQWYEIRLPDATALAQVMARVHAADLPYVEEDSGIFVDDPSGNSVLLAVPTANGD
jgi:catechol 2,3-dioxygenase